MTARTFTVTTYTCENGCGTRTFRRNLPVVDCPTGWGLGPHPARIRNEMAAGIPVSRDQHFCPSCTIGLGVLHLRTTRDGRTPEEQVALAHVILKLRGSPQDRAAAKAQRIKIQQEARHGRSE